jgi:hypothetical protein
MKWAIGKKSRSRSVEPSGNDLNPANQIHLSTTQFNEVNHYEKRHGKKRNRKNASQSTLEGVRVNR